ncbi:MAG: hypothetical protein R3E82_07990 [Pseudomonadales bacterium]
MSAAPARRLWKATLASFVVAVVVLFTLVLPAEYGVDPLGTGEALGLLGLSRTGPAAVIGAEEGYRQDHMRFELAPFESVEYKYRLEQDAAMLFDWTATGELVYELHAEPDGAEAGYAESFEKGRASAAAGTYLALFPGIHGWFWENRGNQTLTLELHTAGYYSLAIEFRDGDRSERLPSR